VVPATTAPATTTPTTTPDKKPGKPEVMVPTPAEVLVNLPANAKLFVDGQRVELTPTRRTMATPVLQPGQDYFYLLRAEAVRNGQAVAESRRVIVRAGSTTTVDFGSLAATAKEEAGPSRITVHVPENARLYVDGTAVPMTARTRTFDIPNLEPGKSYFYTMKAEVVIDGQTRSEDRRVVVQAGKDVTVDFSNLETVTTAQR
jgi:uncharacterized protein (TIGR03000 family)